MSDINKKVVSATKWSTVTEIAAKLVSPVSTMVLARLLTPDAFGILVTATMVISFSELFTDAGFQKYLIQHAFKDKAALYRSTNVAFWSNLILSLIIWGFIILFAEPIATLVGNEGHGDVIAVSCSCIPLAAFSSIQMAIYKRSFDFKTLFFVRIIGVMIPLAVTIPLAYFTRSYWSLIIGMIALHLSNALILTIKSPWKPRWFYDFKLLKEMFSFTMWTMIEQVTIWLCSYIDIFIVGTLLNQYYLGIYRTSIGTVGGIMAIITAATMPVLFSSLSRLQDDDAAFKRMFFTFQKLVGIMVIPMGVGVFMFRELVTQILLGDQWGEASYFIGIWGLAIAIMIVLSYYCSEIYRSMGKPKYSVFAQTIYLIILIPTIYWAVGQDFKTLCEMRSLVCFSLLGINLILVYLLVRISFLDMIKNILPSIVAASVMFIPSLVVDIPSASMPLQIVYIIIASALYFAVLFMFPKEKYMVMNIRKYLKRR